MKFKTDLQLRFALCSLFVLTGLLLFYVYKYQVNPDGIAYLSIARHYSEGHWMEALNNCWPPLLSWILAPWFKLSSEPLWVFKLYNILAGAGCIWTSHLIMKYYDLKKVFVWAGLALLFAYFMMWTFWVTSPDLISVWIMLVYTHWVLNGKIFKFPILTAALGALAYFAKSYCFFFFLAHLSFHYVHMWWLKKYPIQFLVKKYAITMLVFLLICGAWMGILTTKYHQFSISSASAWTHGMLKYPNLSCIENFLPPPNQHAVFAWEDPPMICVHRDWSMFESGENLILQLEVIWRNTKHLLLVLQQDSWYFHVAGFLLMTVALLLKRENAIWKWRRLNELLGDSLFILFPIILVYTFGYLLIFIEPRYVWLGYVLISIGSLVAIQRLFTGWIEIPRRFWILIAITPLIVIGLSLYKYPKMITPLKAVLTQDRSSYNGYQFYFQCQQLKLAMPPGQRMAAFGNNDAKDRTQSWTIAYYNRLHHYGILPSNRLEAGKLIEQFKISIITIPLSDTVSATLLDQKWKRVYPDAGLQSVYIHSSIAK